MARQRYPSDHRRWFRVHEDILDDERVNGLRLEDQALLFRLRAVLNRQKSRDGRGYLDRFAACSIAKRSQWSARARAPYERLAAAGLIELDVRAEGLAFRDPRWAAEQGFEASSPAVRDQFAPNPARSGAEPSLQVPENAGDRSGGTPGTTPTTTPTGEEAGRGVGQGPELGTGVPAPARAPAPPPWPSWVRIPGGQPPPEYEGDVGRWIELHLEQARAAGVRAAGTDRGVRFEAAAAAELARFWKADQPERARARRGPLRAGTRPAPSRPEPPEERRTRLELERERRALEAVGPEVRARFVAERTQQMRRVRPKALGGEGERLSDAEWEAWWGDWIERLERAAALGAPTPEASAGARRRRLVAQEATDDGRNTVAR